MILFEFAAFAGPARRSNSLTKLAPQSSHMNQENNNLWTKLVETRLVKHVTTQGTLCQTKTNLLQPERSGEEILKPTEKASRFWGESNYSSPEIIYFCWSKMHQTSLVKTVFRPDVVFHGIPRYVCGRGLCQLCVCVGFSVVYVCGASFCKLGPDKLHLSWRKIERSQKQNSPNPAPSERQV